MDAIPTDILSYPKENHFFSLNFLNSRLFPETNITCYILWRESKNLGVIFGITDFLI